MNAMPATIEFPLGAFLLSSVHKPGKPKNRSYNSPSVREDHGERLIGNTHIGCWCTHFLFDTDLSYVEGVISHSLGFDHHEPESVIVP